MADYNSPMQVRNKGKMVAYGFVGLIIVLKIGASLIGDVFGDFGTILTAFATPATGDTTADAIISALGILLVVTISFGIVDKFEKGAS